MKNSKNLMRLFSVVLVVVLLFTIMPTGALTVNAATTEFAGGSGTVADPYLIETKEHLNNVRNDLDAHYKLIADIVFSESDFSEGGAFYNKAAGWIPIGSGAQTPFAGSFDGNHFSIIGIVINPVHLYDSVGLFGYTSGSIKNLNMIDCNIELSVHAEYNYSRAASITGTLVGGNIDNCTASGSIVSAMTFDGNIYAGGIVGYALNANITDCSNECTVKATDIYNRTISCAGGVVGVATGCTISSCKNEGAIVVSGFEDNNYAGGICGKSNSTTITTSFNTGSVHAETSASSSGIGAFAGGIAGATSGEHVYDCFNLGNITADTHPESVLTGNDWNGNYSGGIVGKSDGCVTQSCYNVGKVFAAKYYGVSIFGGIVGYSTGPVTDCYYLNTIEKGVGSGSDTAIKLSDEELKNTGNFSGWNFEGVWEFVNYNMYSYPTLVANKYFVYDSSATFAGGSGTATDPYLIASKQHLNNVRNNLDAHYKMIADIVFTDADFAEGGDFYNDGVGWEPIGNAKLPFTGGFNGNGYSIFNLQMKYINAAIEYCGFLGYGNNCDLKNINLGGANYYIETNASSCYVGGIIGHLEKSGCIENCKFDGEVEVSSISEGVDGVLKTGGIVGELYGQTFTIANCVNTSRWTSTAISNEVYTGGICGFCFCYYSTRVLSVNNVNDGEINATSEEKSAYVGGIIGYAYGVDIQCCSNKGSVVACGAIVEYGFGNAGGITGQGNETTISSCINFGDISVIEARYPEVGGISGCNYTESIIENSSNRGNVSSSASSKGKCFTGGVSGINYGRIQSSYNCAEITANAADQFFDINIGGISGENKGTIKNCFNSAGTSAVHSAKYGSICNGGTVGVNSGIIKNCYNSGELSSSATYVYNGGIAALNSGSIANAYYLDIVSKGVSSGDDTSTKCSVEEMSVAVTYSGFDFENVWEFVEGNAYKYPTLREIKHYIVDDSYEFAITFKYEDGTVISSKTYHYGDAVTIPESPSVPEELGGEYVFSGWDKEVTACTGSVVYTAVFRLEYPVGDYTKDNAVTNEDVIYLLWHTLFPESYLVESQADFTGDGQVTNEDVIYLLWHTLFPESYPLTEKKKEILA